MSVYDAYTVTPLWHYVATTTLRRRFGERWFELSRALESSRFPAPNPTDQTRRYEVELALGTMSPRSLVGGCE